MKQKILLFIFPAILNNNLQNFYCFFKVILLEEKLSDLK